MAFWNRERDGDSPRPFLFWAFFPILILTTSQPAMAWDDLFQAASGLDYERVWMKPDLCPGEPLMETFPGLKREGVRCNNEREAQTLPPVSASLQWGYQNLIGKTGDFAFAHDDITSNFDLRLNFIPSLDIRSSVERAHRNRSIGDTGLQVNADRFAWQSRNSASIPLVSWLVPLIAAGWDSEGGWEKAIALQGATRFELSWSLAIGRQGRTYPVILDPKGYQPLSMPLLLKQDIHALSVGWRHDPMDFGWTSRAQISRPPENPGGFYSLTDSGYNLEHIANLAYSDSNTWGHYKAALEGQYNSGSHVFFGIKNSESPYQFGYQDTRNRNYSLRGDVQAGKKRWGTGVFWGTSSLHLTALRPSPVYGNYLWDRNGVLDSYEGNIFSLFNRETWLFDGDVDFRQWAAGGWAAWIAPHWRGQFGMAYNQVNLKAFGHLTKKTTTLLIAYTEEEYFQSFPGVRAHLLTPEMKFSSRWGHAFLEASAAQAIPVSIQLRRAQDPSSGESNSSSSSYSGGTSAGLKIGWGFF